MNINNLSTPALILDEKTFKENMDAMSELLKDSGPCRGLPSYCMC